MIIYNGRKIIMKVQKETIKTVAIHNRKYLGSKYRLLNFIENVILSNCPKIHTFIDGFSGTGVVSWHFKNYAQSVISNDLLYSNYIVNKTFLTTNRKNADLKKVRKLLQWLNKLPPRPGYVTSSYKNTYFTEENTSYIDAIREEIENFYLYGECTFQEYCILLTSLLLGADKSANTMGQYDAYLKNIGGDLYDGKGHHKTDHNVYRKITLNMPDISQHSHERHNVFNQDINRLIKDITGDVLYLDPPYNKRQYSDCYHVLENILLWNKPPLFGKTRKFKSKYLKSCYSRKKMAAGAFTDLIQNARVQHIFLSYNNEGLLPDSFIIDVLSRRGLVQIFEHSYPVFGNGAGLSVKRKIRERIFYCKIDNK